MFLPTNRIALWAACLLTLSLASLQSADTKSRSGRGLLALYEFGSASGRIVSDTSGAGAPLDLVIETPKEVRRAAGQLVVRGDARIRSKGPAKKLFDTIRRSHEMSIEAWIEPANTKQKGPARIVTLSGSSTARNFTLGQEGGHYDVRLRVSSTSGNGLPSTATKSGVRKALTHVVYTRSHTGRALVYVDGKLSAEREIPGDPLNWDRKFRLGLGNESSGGRPWRGTFHLVAIYSRDLTAREVSRHFRAGPDAGTSVDLVRKVDPGAHFFETKIAPILANHCLDCHDPASRKGKLDLSQKSTALAGGRDGPVIVPGKSASSVLWEQIESDEMPPKRTPLSAEQKALIKRWIDSGATWSLDVVDPAVYVHEGRGGENWIRRLTVDEYIATVETSVGVDIAEHARRILPPDLRADGFSNTAYNLSVDLKHVDAYARLAQLIVEKVDLKTFAAKFTNSRKLDEKNVRRFVRGAGALLLRGPLSDREVNGFLAVYRAVLEQGGEFDEVAAYLVETMFQSPRFIYRMEDQRGDGTVFPVGEYELASRISYIVQGGPPDDALLKAAGDGELSDAEGIEREVNRLLATDQAVTRSKQFIHQWLDLDRLRGLRPNAKRFPTWSDDLARDMQDETRRFFEEMVWERKKPLADLLSAQFTYATPRLARHYGLEPKPGGDGLARYDLSKVKGRGGLLTHGSVLTIGG
ncbi:MAG: DUF1592 domain-containing protein, partial [Planctomycetota bacterium]